MLECVARRAMYHKVHSQSRSVYNKSNSYNQRYHHRQGPPPIPPLHVDTNRRRSSEQIREGSPHEVSLTSPKPVFRKSPHHKKKESQFSASHEELIRHFQSSWREAEREIKIGQSTGSSRVAVFSSAKQWSFPENFQPFNLDEWFTQRLLKDMDIDPKIISS